MHTWSSTFSESGNCTITIVQIVKALLMAMLAQYRTVHVTGGGVLISSKSCAKNSSVIGSTRNESKSIKRRFKLRCASVA